MKESTLFLIGAFCFGVATGAVMEARCRNVGNTFLKPMYETKDINVGDKVEYRYQDNINYCKEMRVIAMVATDNNNLVWVQGHYCTLSGVQLDGTYILRLRDLIKL